MSKGKVNKWILVVRHGRTLRPYANYDEEMLEKIRQDTPVRIQIAQPRSLPRHRLYWVVLRQVIKNTELFATEEALHKTLLVASGVVEPIVTVDGTIIMIPSSIAFDAMQEEEFKSYFDRSMEIISTKVISGIDIDELLEEAKEQARWKDAA